MLFMIERTTVAVRSGPTVRGELDVATAPELAAAVDAQLASSSGPLVLDLTGTTFLDSSGARQLMRSARSAAASDVTLHVVCPPENRAVRLVVDLLNLGALVPIVGSVAELGGPGGLRPRLVERETGQ